MITNTVIYLYCDIYLGNVFSGACLMKEENVLLSFVYSDV